MSRLVVPGWYAQRVAAGRGQIGLENAKNEAGDEGGGDGFAARVAKYLPVEIIAAYAGLNGLLDAIKTEYWKVLAAWIALVVGAVLTPAYLAKQAAPGQPRTLHLVLSTLSFVVWCYAIQSPPLWGILPEDPALASFIALVFSLAIGVLVQPASRTSP